MKSLSTLHCVIAGRLLCLLAQSQSSYHGTHTYTLGGDGSGKYVVPDSSKSPVVHPRQPDASWSSTRITEPCWRGHRASTERTDNIDRGSYRTVSATAGNDQAVIHVRHGRRSRA